MKPRSAALAGLIVLAGILPLLVARPAPLQDWPNHVARMHILVGLLQGDAFWQRFYRLTGFLVPNAAMDVCILDLQRLGLSVATAAQVFLIGVYLVFVGGFCALAAAFGGLDRARPGVAVLLFYCHALFWGLVNYMLGVGALLGLLAAWVAAEARPGRRLAIAAFGAVLLLFTHAVPAVVWVGVLGCFDLVQFLRSREAWPARLLHSASWLLAAVVVLGLLRALPGGTGHDLAVGYAGRHLAGIVVRKLLLFGKVLLGGGLLQDATSLLALLACVAVGLLGRPRLAAGPALASLALLALSLVAPERIGTGSLLDERLAVLPLILAAAAVQLRAPTRSLLAVDALVLLRTLVLAAQFYADGTVFRDYRERTQGLPAGAVMLIANGTALPSLSWQTIWAPPVTSMATQVVFGGIFVPHVFANPAQQPMQMRAEYGWLTEPWDLTDAPRLLATALALRPLCNSHRFTGVYLTVLYPAAFIRAHAGGALLQHRPDFLILDACRLPMRL